MPTGFTKRFSVVLCKEKTGGVSRVGVEILRSKILPDLDIGISYIMEQEQGAKMSLALNYHNRVANSVLKKKSIKSQKKV